MAKQLLPITILTNKIFKSTRGRFLFLFGVIGVILIVVIAFSGPSQSPIPKSILSSVSFPVYYPDPGRIPAGYSLDSKHIERINPGVVILFISRGAEAQYVVISEEANPGSPVINHFLADNIPLHSNLSTPLGTAAIGAYNDGREERTVISLPVINGGPWIIATAPGNANLAQFSKIVEVLIKS